MAQQPGLAAWRRQRGMTQRELAAKAQVAPSTIEELEQSMRPNVRHSTMRKIALAVGAVRNGEPAPALIEEFRVAIIAPPRRRGPPRAKKPAAAQDGVVPPAAGPGPVVGGPEGALSPPSPHMGLGGGGHAGSVPARRRHVRVMRGRILHARRLAKYRPNAVLALPIWLLDSGLCDVLGGALGCLL